MQVRLVPESRVFSLHFLEVRSTLCEVQRLATLTRHVQTEMDCIAGQVQLPKGTAGQNLDATTGLYEGVAYGSQMPWLQHASIKNVGHRVPSFATGS